MQKQGWRARRKRRILLTCISMAVIVAIVVCLGIVNAKFPFVSLFSPYRLPARQEGEMRLHFLSVGQGDCTIVEFADGAALVVDAGDGSSTRHISRYLKALNAPSYTYLATHADADHCGGFSALLGHFPADMVYLPAVESEGNAYHALLETVRRTGAPTRTLTRYDTIGSNSGGYAVCLSPYSQGEEDDNEASTVLYLSYAGVNTVLGADVSWVRESALLMEYGANQAIFDRGELMARLSKTDILKVSHHGSENATSFAWLSLLRPKTAIVSCGKGNPFGHPAGETIERLSEIGAEVYRTDELGDIMIVISKGGTYRLQTNRSA